MAFPYPYRGPIALYNNLPINANYYQPSQFFISTVTLGNPTVVTTTVSHNYVVGQLVRLIIPSTFGCRQLNEQQGYVVAVPAANQVSVSINTTSADPFTSSSATTQPQIMAIGDINSGQTNTIPSTVSTFIPGSFQNISPL